MARDESKMVLWNKEANRTRSHLPLDEFCQLIQTLLPVIKDYWAVFDNNLIRPKPNPIYLMLKYTYFRQIHKEC